MAKAAPGWRAPPASAADQRPRRQRHWVLGLFYVNREDPSLFIENRFGFGYTVNFGNPKAVALFLAFILLVLGLPLGSILFG